MSTTIDVRAILGSIRTPTLVLHRRDDAMVPVDAGRYMAAQIPGARFVELPGADHLPFVGDWEAFAPEAQAFLTGTPPPPDPDRMLTTCRSGTSSALPSGPSPSATGSGTSCSTPTGC